jgi:methionyl-tRNA formyltransferase
MKKEDLKIVFLGTPDFAVESLDLLCKEGFNIVGVVTMPDKPAGRGHKMFESPVKRYAMEHGMKIMQPVKLKDPEFVDELRSLNADLFIVIAFRMLPEVVWQMPRLGTFNLHASLLPRYRGAAPINWAVINGDTKTGVTTFFLKHEIDTGEIIQQEEIDILPEENVGDIHDKLMHLGATLTLDTVNNILTGNLTTTPQEEMLTEGEEPTPAPKIFKETCRIDWNQPIEKVHNLVRGLSPYPCAWTEIHDGSAPTDAPALYNIKIQATKISNQEAPADTEPGTIFADKQLRVACGDGKLLEILQLQPSGKKPMTAAEFLRGAHLPEFGKNY